MRRHLFLAAVVLFTALGAPPPARAQLPKSPQNLQVLPKNLTTDSVFAIMLDMAGSLGVTCGSCHPGGDNRTWDSTNFTGDIKPMKATAREMFRMTKRLNDELLPAALGRSSAILTVTCATCHRGAKRPVTIVDTIVNVADRQGTDSAIAEYQRLREKYTGRMAYDFTDYPLRVIAATVLAKGQKADAVKILEYAVRLFPQSTGIARDLAKLRGGAGRR